MKFALAVYGSRGDVEPQAAVGRELLRRGHEVCIAVPPDLCGLAESAGVPAVTTGRTAGRCCSARRHIRSSCCPQQGVLQPDVGGDGRDADVADGRGRSAIDGRGAAGACRQCRGILRYSAGHAALLAGAGQRPAYSEPAVAIDPLCDFGVLVGVLARDEGGRGSPAPQSWACRRQPGPRRDGSSNADRSRSRPTTFSAFPGWQPNGRNGMANGPSSAR